MFNFPKKVLVVGAHTDDNELSASGLIIRFTDKKIKVKTLCFCSCEEQPGNEGITEEWVKAQKKMRVKDYILLDYPNTKLPEHRMEIHSVLDELVQDYDPDFIITHSLTTIHQDHKIIAETAQRIFRNKSVLGYEDVKSVPFFKPQFFVILDEYLINKKLEVIKCFKTQFRRYYHTIDFYLSQARFRGMQVNEQYAEAYDIVHLKYLQS